MRGKGRRGPRREGSLQLAWTLAAIEKSYIRSLRSIGATLGTLGSISVVANPDQSAIDVQRYPIASNAKPAPSFRKVMFVWCWLKREKTSTPDSFLSERWYLTSSTTRMAHEQEILDGNSDLKVA